MTLVVSNETIDLDMARRMKLAASSRAAGFSLPSAAERSALRTDSEPMRKWYALSQFEWARVLGVSRATVARWAAERSGPDRSSAEGRLFALLEDIRVLAERLRRDPARFRAWLRAPSPALRGRPPLDVLLRQGPAPIRDLLLDELQGTYA